MAVFDASVLIPALDSGHAQHEDARRALAKETVIAVGSSTLAEVTRVIRRRANLVGLDGNRIARDALAGLRAMHGYRRFADDVEEAAFARYEADARLSFVDAWTIELAKATGQELLTFDRDHRRAWKAAK